MITLTWVLGIVGTLGLGGVAVIYFFFPAIAAIIVPIIEKIIARIISCKPCMIAIAMVVIAFGSFWGGYHQAKVSDRSAELAAALAAKNADIEAAKKAANDANDKANSIEATANEQHQKDQDYIASLKSRPACDIDSSDLPVGMRNSIRSRIPKFTTRSK